MDLGDAVYKALTAKQLINAADQALESQRQDSTLAAAQGYYDVAKAKAIVDVFKEALSISQDYQKQLHEAVGAERVPIALLSPYSVLLYSATVLR